MTIVQVSIYLHRLPGGMYVGFGDVHPTEPQGVHVVGIRAL